jgi:uncharacterized protein (DUF58 family)
MTGTLWWWLLAGLFVVSALRHSTSLFLLALLLSAASLASLLWSRYALAQVQFRRHLGQDRLAFAEETDLVVDIYNAKPLPVPWLLASDEYPEGLTLLTGKLGMSSETAFRRALINLVSLRWYERVRRTYRVRGDKRGVYQFGPAELEAGDIFGLRRQRKTVATTDTLLVYPKIVPIEELGLPAARPVGELATKTRLIEDPLRYLAVRPYRPGDSLRHIHWRATARSQKAWPAELYTRSFEASSSQVLELLVDVQTADNPYSIVPAYLEFIISAAASIAVAALQDGYAVGLLANAGASSNASGGGRYGPTVVPAGRSPAQAVTLLEALADLSNFRLLPAAQLLERTGAHSTGHDGLPLGATLLALTAQPANSVGFAQLQEALLSLQDQGHPVALLAAGDEAPTASDQIPTYYLGGEDAWQRLAGLELA